MMDYGRQTVYERFAESRQAGKKKFAILIDPDKMRLGRLDQVVDLAVRYKADFFFLGGSLIVHNQLDQCIQLIRQRCQVPIVLFPGSSFQLSNRADAILFLSLVSGRNPDLLIGQHVVAAPYIRRSNLEVLPTGYMLIDGGTPTSVQYMSGTLPIPAQKTDIAACTAMAAEMLGLRMLFLDAGSGATTPVSADMIAAVRAVTHTPIIVGGGIRSADKVQENLAAGADIIVIGTAVEEDPSLLIDISAAIHAHNVTLNV